MENVRVKWDQNQTNPIDDDNAAWFRIPYSRSAGVLGEALPDGTFAQFGLTGDSGAVVVKLTQDKVTGKVTKSEAVGLMYTIVLERDRPVHVGVYMSLPEVYEAIFKDSGLRLSIDAMRGVGETEMEEWQFTELGRGRSTYDIT